MLLTRRRLLQHTLALSGSSLLAACGGTPHYSQSLTTTQSNMNRLHHTPSSNSDNSMRLFASSGYCEDPARIERGIHLLASAGFDISNQAAAYRRFQRFAGSDAERIADLQDIATGRVATPKIIMGVRGGYGAARLLPHIDWQTLGARMREMQTLLFGFSDVTAIQLALLAKSGVSSFAGPMLYSEFAKPTPNAYTMDSFVRTTSQHQSSVSVGQPQHQTVREAAGILWGGNLSVLAALVGTPYMPNIQGGLLFLEDVAEQPYRIERMLQTLHLSGILKQQQAIILGDFRMGNIRDSYDARYDLNQVARTISRVAAIPVYQHFPFGHVAQKTTFPLGAPAHLRPSADGGYQITFSQYPTLNAQSLNLSALLPTTYANTDQGDPNETQRDSEF